MSQCYGPLAARYDALTGDVPYEALETWYETAFAHSGRGRSYGFGSLLRYGYALAASGRTRVRDDLRGRLGGNALGVPAKLCELPEGVVAPMLLCQRAEKLDLYDTVDAAVCSLDGVNYMRPETLPEVFRRLHLFLSPGGTLCFDFLSPGHMRSLDGQCFVDEEDDTLCLWRSEVVENELRYGMDIFRRIKGQTYRREQEEHTEYIYTPETLEKHLVDAGFGSIRLYGRPAAQPGTALLHRRVREGVKKPMPPFVQREVAKPRF